MVWTGDKAIVKTQNKNVFLNDYEGDWKMKSLCEFIKRKGWKRIGITTDDSFDGNYRKVQFLNDNQQKYKYKVVNEY